MIEVDLSAAHAGFSLTAKFEARAEAIVCVFGPSGAGKTTLLRLIAGLESPLKGRIAIGGVALTDTRSGVHVPPEGRQIGYVFQDSRLFPHLNVRENLCYGLHRATRRRLALGDVVDALGIAPLLDRAPRALSGGERQRVALGRALLAQPRLILMDEPLAGVDWSRKSEVLDLIRLARARFGASIVYVSHDLDETAALADDLVLVNQGAVRAYGPAARLFADPDLVELADRADARAILDLPLTDPAAGPGLCAYGEAPRRLLAPPAVHGGEGLVRFQIYARDVTLALAPPSGLSVRNLIPAQVKSARRRGDGQVLVCLDTPLDALLAIITEDAAQAMAIEPGKHLTALVKAAAIR